MIYEVWEDIPNVPGYEASNFGRIANRRGQVMSFQEEQDGRMRSSLRPNGVRQRFLLHKLVMWAFVGECPEGYEVNHIDGDCKNNVLSNLEYVTKRRNYDHAVELGLHPRNEEHPLTKLTKADVQQILAELIDPPWGKSKELSQRYGVSQTWISNIKRGKVRKYAGKDWATMKEVG